MFKKIQKLSKRTQKLFGLSMAIMMGMAASSALPSIAGESKLKVPTNIVKKTKPAVYDCTPDLVLIMPTDNPWIILVATPVWEASAILLTGDPEV